MRIEIACWVVGGGVVFKISDTYKAPKHKQILRWLCDSKIEICWVNLKEQKVSNLLLIKFYFMKQ